MDVTQAIQPKSDQINADTLVTGPITIKITDVRVDPGAAQQPIEISFEGSDKYFRPCKTASRCLAAVWGSNATAWVGMHCTLYNDPTVTFGGVQTGGIRISHMEGLDKPIQLNLTKSRSKRGIVTIQPLHIDGASTTEPIDPAPIFEAAREAAKKGRDGFGVWWKSNKEHHETVKPIMDELRAIVEQYKAPEIDPDEMPL